MSSSCRKSSWSAELRATTMRGAVQLIIRHPVGVRRRALAGDVTRPDPVVPHVPPHAADATTHARLPIAFVVPGGTRKSPRAAVAPISPDPGAPRAGARTLPAAVTCNVTHSGHSVARLFPGEGPP